MMKSRAVALVVMICGVSISSHAAVTRSVDGNVMTAGYMNVFELPVNGGGFVFGSSWGVADLSAYFTNTNYEVTLVPNSIGDPAEFWYIGGGAPGNPGNKIMEANLYAEVVGDYAGQILTFTGVIDENTLSNTHTLVAFIKDFEPDYSSFNIAQTDLTGVTGAFSVNLSLNTDTNRPVQYGFAMTGPNVWATDLEPFGKVVVQISPDTEPPAPAPTFESGPAATGDNSISMTATEAVDNLTDVEYYFFCTNSAAFDSGWTGNRTYEVDGLAPGTQYGFQVAARDTHPNQNTTVTSAVATATTTNTDNDPPAPAPTFAVAPIAINSGTIAMESTVATDPGGVEYFFDCIEDDGLDSGWQSGTDYEVSGLAPESEYTFTVQARDLSSQTNLTAVSGTSSATTPALIKFMVNSLKGYTGTTSNLATRAAIGADSLEFGSVLPSGAEITFDSTGAAFGLVDTGYLGRNILRTVGSDYDTGSFEAYATFLFNGATDQAAFFGMGMGIVAPEAPGNFGVPELALGGVNGIVAEMKTILSNGDPKGCNLIKIIDGFQQDQQTGPVATVDTLRAKLAYDAIANTVTVSIDTNYTGGVFVEDRVLGTWVATNTPGVSMWEDIPVRVYAGGGEGMVVSDLEIVRPVPQVGIDFSAIIPVATGAELSWPALGGLTYEVQYKTDLVGDPTWTTDPSPGCSDLFATVDGTLSATSTVSGAEVYYRLLTQ